MKKLILALTVVFAALLTSCETAQVTVRTNPASVYHRPYVTPSLYDYDEPFYQRPVFHQRPIYRERTRVIIDKRPRTRVYRGG